MTVTAPDQSVWWDVVDIAAAARAILRLTDADVDADRIAELVPVAGWNINSFADRAGPLEPGDVDPLLRRNLIDLTVAFYRDKDTPPASPDLAFGLGYRPADPLSQIRGQLLPSKERFGIG